LLASRIGHLSFSLALQDSVCKIDKTGKVTLRVRIEEVSKNHQKQVRCLGFQEGFANRQIVQAFCIKLQPDSTSVPGNMDIAGGTVPSFLHAVSEATRFCR
jgi:hypothetical protein